MLSMPGKLVWDGSERKAIVPLNVKLSCQQNSLFHFYFFFFFILSYWQEKQKGKRFYDLLSTGREGKASRIMKKHLWVPSNRRYQLCHHWLNVSCTYHNGVIASHSET